jgi:hypothetical protein
VTFNLSVVTLIIVVQTAFAFWHDGAGASTLSARQSLQERGLDGLLSTLLTFIVLEGPDCACLGAGRVFLPTLV